MISGEAPQTEEFIRKVCKAFREALDLMEIDAPQTANLIIESWIRYFVRWKGRRVVGFENPEDIAVKLLADSFAISYAAGDICPLRTLDIGSGNGWPGLAVKALFPDAHVTLLDSRKGSCDFMKGYIETAGLSGVEVLEARAEEVAHVSSQREQYSLVTSRAVADPPVCLELSTGFLKQGGQVALWVGPGQKFPKEADYLVKFGLRHLFTHGYCLPHGMGDRLLVLYLKESFVEEDIPRSYASIKGASRKSPQ